MATKLPMIGFIGLGAMGGPMTCNLLKAGYPVYAFDLDQERLAVSVSAGAIAATSTAEVVACSEIVLTSLPSSATFVRMAEESLLPNVQPGQIIIDVGTTMPPETRRLAALFAAKGVELLDVPVSGGSVGAKNAQLYMFVGGAEKTFTRCYALLEVLGGPDQITYCGPSGCGQIVKGVNQLMMGLADAAYLEALAFGINAGVDAATIHQAIGHTGRWRQDFNDTAGRVVQGEGEQVGVKFRELPYFLREAEERAFQLPLTKTLYEFCNGGERVTIDDNRCAPSFWHELTTKD